MTRVGALTPGKWASATRNPEPVRRPPAQRCALPLSAAFKQRKSAGCWRTALPSGRSSGVDLGSAMTRVVTARDEPPGSGGGVEGEGGAAEPEGGALQDPRLHTEPTSRLLEMLCSEHPLRGPHHALLSWLTGHVSSSSEFSLLERKLSEDENKHRTNSQFQRWGLDRARQRGSTP